VRRNAASSVKWNEKDVEDGGIWKSEAEDGLEKLRANELYTPEGGPCANMKRGAACNLPTVSTDRRFQYEPKALPRGFEPSGKL